MASTLLPAAQAQSQADAFGGGARPGQPKDLEARVGRLEQELNLARGSVRNERLSGGVNAPSSSGVSERPLTPEELGYRVKGTLNGVRMVEHQGVTDYMGEVEFAKFAKKAKELALELRAADPLAAAAAQGRSLNLPPPPSGAAGTAAIGRPLPPGTALANKPGQAAPAAPAAPAPAPKPPATPPAATAAPATPPATAPVRHVRPAPTAPAANTRPTAAPGQPTAAAPASHNLSATGNTAAARQAARASVPN